MNYLLILTDQMHKYAWSGERDYVITPNLKRLADEGAVFDAAYTSCPICTPYRGVLFSGNYISQTGTTDNNQPLPQGIKTMAGILNDIGYETSFVGKYHLGGGGNTPITEDIRADFKHFLGYQCYNGFLKDICFYDENDNETQYQGHRTDVTTQLGIDRLNMLAETKKPFLHVIFYQAPHYPEQPSKPYAALYKDTVFPMPLNYEDIDPYTPTFSPRSPRPFENCPDYQKYHDDIQTYLQLYYGMVSQIDAGVGRLMDELDKLGIADDTMILFSSDHGDMQGSHGLKNKCLPYEESCGAPFIVRCPEGKKGIHIKKPISTVDILPTLMDISDIKKDDELPGESFYAKLKEETYNGGAIAFAEFFIGDNNWILIRDDRYKLVINFPEENPVMLYDILNDKFETDNLIDNNDAKHIKTRLISEFEKWKIKTGFDFKNIHNES